MPIVNIKIIEGRTREQKRTLAQAVTRAVCDSLGVADKAVWISIDEMKPENLAQGGTLRADKT